MAEVLNMTPVPGAAGTYQLDPALQAILGVQGSSPYTPELTADALAGIRRRRGEMTASAVSAAQSDALKRGATGSSVERLGMTSALDLGGRAEQDEVLQFMLGAADRGAQDRQFKTGLLFQDYQDRVARAHEERLANQYMVQLAREQAEDRRRRKKSGLGGAITGGVGAVVGGIYGGPAGASAGYTAGSGLGQFLFS